MSQLCRCCDRVWEENEVSLIVKLFHRLYTTRMTEKILNFRASIIPEVAAQNKWSRQTLMAQE
jgi:hypothetical protein